MWALGVPVKLEAWSANWFHDIIWAHVCDIAGNKFYDRYRDIALSIRSLVHTNISKWFLWTAWTLWQTKLGVTLKDCHFWSMGVGPRLLVFGLAVCQIMVLAMWRVGGLTLLFWECCANGGLSRLHSVDKDAVLWLTSYGWWHAYEKEKKTGWGFHFGVHGVKLITNVWLRKTFKRFYYLP